MIKKNPVFNFTQVLHNISTLIEKARQENIPVIYVQHSDDNIIEGTLLWAIHPSIIPLKNELVVQKHTPDSFYNTNLQDELKKKGIRKLVICGMQTEYCVDTTCRRAFSLGYDVILVEDGHSSWDNKHISAGQVIAHHNLTLNGWAVKVKSLKDIHF